MKETNETGLKCMEIDQDYFFYVTSYKDLHVQDILSLSKDLFYGKCTFYLYLRLNKKVYYLPPFARFRFSANTCI